MVLAAAAVYILIREGIVTGVYPPGTRLREQELALATGMSRTPVREALQRLHAEGMVRILPHRGAVVTEWTTTELDELLELRTLLEGHAARGAALRVTREDLVELCVIAEQMDVERANGSVKALDRFAELTLELHRRISVIAANQQLASILTGIIQAAIMLHTVHVYTVDELALASNHHHELILALEAHDPDWSAAVMTTIAHADRNSLRRARAERLAHEARGSQDDENAVSVDRPDSCANDFDLMTGTSP